MPAPSVTGSAGSSAQRTYERRSSREKRRKEQAVAADDAWRSRVKADHPLLGRLATAVTPKPAVGPESQATRAWAEGAAGERRVAEVLASCSGVIALHDRRIPGTRSNIDHLAVTPTGVFVIDAKRYDGAVEIRDRGGWL
ncbi:MAG TPA: nuclease-related domain-containing protein, partial [Acidimicrobiales bacterium]|nr:nuclease-related domain-containing protein [Acidimicrobiales bacterium]